MSNPITQEMMNVSIQFRTLSNDIKSVGDNLAWHIEFLVALSDNPDVLGISLIGKMPGKTVNIAPSINTRLHAKLKEIIIEDTQNRIEEGRAKLENLVRRLPVTISPSSETAAD